MKRTLTVLLALLFALSAAACTASPLPQEQLPSRSEETPAQPEPPEASPQPETDIRPETPVEPDASADPQTDVPPETDDQPEVPADVPNHAYFADALFVGDSIMEGIRQYVALERKSGDMLPGARFLASTAGITLADLVGDRIGGPRYRWQGEELPFTDIVTAAAPGKLFLLLGLNDMAAADADLAAAMDRYSRLIDLLRTTVPGAEIIVITNPPKVAGSWLPDYTANRSFGNELIDSFVAALTQLCSEKNVPVVDAHTALSDDSGVLPEEWCRDGFVHLSNEGSAVVVDLVYDFAAAR